MQISFDGMVMQALAWLCMVRFCMIHFSVVLFGTFYENVI
jgi:hypothetical protein